MPSDFFPSLKPEGDDGKKDGGKPKQTWEQQLAFAKVFSQAMGVAVDEQLKRS